MEDGSYSCFGELGCVNKLTSCLVLEVCLGRARQQKSRLRQLDFLPRLIPDLV